MLAASNTTSWTVNDGNVGVEATDADINRKPFSHTRVYNVVAGSQIFYAIAQNYVETSGNGMATIYGNLSVEFVPDGGDGILESEGINQTSLDLANTMVLAQSTINPTVAGRVIVHFDGHCFSDVGDRIILAASNTTSWSPNDGNVPSEAFDTDISSNSFSHTRVYDVVAGSHTFYAVAQNYVELDGNGIASIYGNLTVQFIPSTSSIILESQSFSTSWTDVTTTTDFAQVTINPSSSGKAIVHFDGACASDVGDRIVLAASDALFWQPNDGNVNVEVPNTDQNHNSFSHTRVYPVTSGSHTFYALAQNYVETDGDGNAAISGILTVEFVPDATNGLDEGADLNIEIFPNPTNDKINIIGLSPSSIVNVHSVSGEQLFSKTVMQETVSIDLSKQNSGVYFVQIISQNGTAVKKVVKK